ncbi:UDP-glucosyltransferase 2-like isoform X2 [Schistocerca gregaria]|uniref:UDP-glucosyltransferase 2-like isoform X2 n=1 Tax=Schistocerca gregaria TaxID=7010 RepID=UPI00211E811E|nr:UDP-glucosyltransferase 2-like isoform X2 [Schistocerca gregaria]
MKAHIRLVALVVCLAVGACNAARILALFHYPGGSHFNTLGRLVRELAARGHHLTVVSHVPLDSPPANYTDVSIRGSAPLVTDTFSVTRLFYAAKKDLGLLDLGITREIASYLFNIDFRNCKVAYEHPAIEDLIRSIRSGQKQFDLVIVHALTIDCFDPFTHLLGGVPLVAVSTNVMTPWCSDRVANPHNPAYVGTYFLPYETANMGFYERFLNTVYHLFVKFELEQFLSGSAHGAVYVSLGSLIAFHTLPLDKMRAVLEALSSLEQRVLLRCDASQLPAGVRLPSNVRASRWLPQTAILVTASAPSSCLGCFGTAPGRRWRRRCTGWSTSSGTGGRRTSGPPRCTCPGTSTCCWTSLPSWDLVQSQRAR